MNVYVVECHEESYLGDIRKSVHGIFESREDAIESLQQMRVPCYRDVANGMWKLKSWGKPVESGVAQPVTKNGEVWELCGPDLRLVDGSGTDEPEFTIKEYEVGKMREWHV